MTDTLVGRFQKPNVNFLLDVVDRGLVSYPIQIIEVRGDTLRCYWRAKYRNYGGSFKKRYIYIETPILPTYLKLLP